MTTVRQVNELTAGKHQWQVQNTLTYSDRKTCWKFHGHKLFQLVEVLKWSDNLQHFKDATKKARKVITKWHHWDIIAKHSGIPLKRQNLWTILNAQLFVGSRVDPCPRFLLAPNVVNCKEHTHE